MDLSAGRGLCALQPPLLPEQAKHKFTYEFCRLISFAIAWMGCQGESLLTLHALTRADFGPLTGSHSVHVLHCDAWLKGFASHDDASTETVCPGSLVSLQ